MKKQEPPPLSRAVRVRHGDHHHRHAGHHHPGRRVAERRDGRPRAARTAQPLRQRAAARRDSRQRRADRLRVAVGAQPRHRRRRPRHAGLHRAGRPGRAGGRRRSRWSTSAITPIGSDFGNSVDPVRLAAAGAAAAPSCRRATCSRRSRSRRARPATTRPCCSTPRQHRAGEQSDRDLYAGTSATAATASGATVGQPSTRPDTYIVTLTVVGRARPRGPDLAERSRSRRARRRPRNFVFSPSEPEHRPRSCSSTRLTSTAAAGPARSSATPGTSAIRHDRTAEVRTADATGIARAGDLQRDADRDRRPRPDRLDARRP